ncbi:hypothetical protein D3C72_2356040 [compost metagenome]
MHPAWQHDSVIFGDVGRLEGVVDLEIVCRLVVVPAFDLAALVGKDIDLDAALLKG